MVGKQDVFAGRLVYGQAPLIILDLVSLYSPVQAGEQDLHGVVT